MPLRIEAEDSVSDVVQKLNDLIGEIQCNFYFCDTIFCSVHDNIWLRHYALQILDIYRCLKFKNKEPII